MFVTVDKFLYRIFVLVGLLGLVTQADLDVCLKDMGCMRGTLMPGYQETAEFEAFLGIPFAQPPVAELRLRNPVPAAPWKGVLNATEARASCLQKNYFTPNWDVMGQEDCLYLNVYRPKDIAPTEQLPVMVYIFSGGFFSGSAHPTIVGPEYLMDTQEIILVSLGYRLGPFGFLSTGDKHMPGNFGFKDQRLALQWVQKHISSFGGDANLVTIFGHSAGGVSTHYHMLSENSKGLFHRSMSLSGNGFASYMNLLKDPLQQAQKLAERLDISNYKGLSTQELAAALRQVDAMALLNSGDASKTFDTFPLVSFRHVIEEPCPEAFFTEDPLKTHLEGRIHEVPWLLGTGSTAGEGATFIFRALDLPEIRKEFNSRFLENFGQALDIRDGMNSSVVQNILDIYGQSEIKELNLNTFASLAKILGDFHFVYPKYEAAKTYTKMDQLSIYDFDYMAKITFGAVYARSVSVDVGSVHMDDALHTIGMTALMPIYPIDSIDAKVTKRMTTLLINFAKTGILSDKLELLPCKAEDFTSNEMCNYFRFGGARENFVEEIDKKINLQGLDLWRKLYLQ